MIATNANERGQGLRPAEWFVVAGTLLIVVFAVVVGRIIYVKPPPVRFVQIDSELGRKGEMVLRRENCLSCHEIFHNGTTVGPNLDGVGSRRSASWLKEYLRAPRAGVGIKPYRLVMPAYDKLPAEELDALVAYLGNLQEVAAQDAAPETRVSVVK